MKQVPNPLPKVLSRRGVGAGMEAAERESFERTQVRTSNPGASLGHPEWCRVLRGFEGSEGLADPGGVGKVAAIGIILGCGTSRSQGRQGPGDQGEL